MNVPDTVGVPEIVIVFADQVALIPAGRPFAPETPALEIPVAPVVECVMLVPKVVLIQRVGVEDGAEAVLFGVTVIVPVAFMAPQPPVSGIE